MYKMYEIWHLDLNNYCINFINVDKFKNFKTKNKET